MVNKMRVGHSEYSIFTWIASVVPLMIILFISPPPIPEFQSYYMFITILIIFSIVMGIFAICWLPFLIAKNQLRPQIDKCKPGESTWLVRQRIRLLEQDG